MRVCVCLTNNNKINEILFFLYPFFLLLPMYPCYFFMDIIHRNRYGWSDFSERFVFTTSHIGKECENNKIKLINYQHKPLSFGMKKNNKKIISYLLQ